MISARNSMRCSLCLSISWVCRIRARCDSREEETAPSISRVASVKGCFRPRSSLLLAARSTHARPDLSVSGYQMAWGKSSASFKSSRAGCRGDSELM